jgi:hypothetical protein
MRRSCVAAGAAALALGVVACGGYDSSSPTAPNNSAPPPSDAITINVWHNVDSTTHRVVLDDGELDTGNIAPGAFSQAMTLVGPGPYHCSIHPEMIGRIADKP